MATLTKRKHLREMTDLLDQYVGKMLERRWELMRLRADPREDTEYINIRGILEEVIHEITRHCGDDDFSEIVTKVASIVPAYFLQREDAILSVWALSRRVRFRP